MIAHFDDAAFFEGNDLVRVTDGGQPVGDDQGGVPLQHLLQRLLDQILSLGVN